MIKWIKDLLGITTLEAQNKALLQKLNQQKISVDQHYTELCSRVRYLEDFNVADIDIGGPRDNSTVILTGVVKGKPYVQFHDLSGESFLEVKQYVENIKKHYNIRHIDSPTDLPKEMWSIDI